MVGRRIFGNGTRLEGHQGVAREYGSTRKGDLGHCSLGIHVGHLDLPNILIRFAQLSHIPSLALVTHGLEKFLGGTDYVVFSTHLDISPIARGDENRFALHKLANHGVEVIIPSSDHRDQSRGTGVSAMNQCTLPA